jgi:hypothetical protein
MSGLLALAAACLPPPPPWQGEVGTTVGLVGDSLLRHAEFGPGRPSGPGRLSGALVDEGYRASLTARVGAETSDLAPITSFPDPGAALLVVALGTNDMHRGEAVEVVIHAIDAFIEAIAPRCTVLVTIVDEPSWGLDVTAPPFNAALVALAATRGDVVVADWGAAVDVHPEYLRAGDVHHTDAGQEAYRRLIVDGVLACDALTEPEPESEPDP